MLVCPNKSSKEWKTLSEAVGENFAMLAFIRNGNSMPESVERARELTTDKGFLENLERINTLTVNDLEQMIIGGAVYPDGVKIGSQTFYTMKGDPMSRDYLSYLTNEYGLVFSYKDDMLAVNPEAVEMWNKFARSQNLGSKSATDLSKMFLKRIGVKVSELDDVLARYGSNGIADIGKRMVSIQAGMMDVALPEEAFHFFIEMMPQDDQFLVEALDKIRLKPIYAETLAKYKDNPNYQINGVPNFAKIRKEALAKELASQLEKKTATGFLEALIQRIIDWIKNVRLRPDPFQKLQEFFLAEDISFLNRNLTSNEIYNQLADDKKEYYEKQMSTEDQRQTLNKMMELTFKVNFKEEDHSYTYMTGERMLSVTTVLGSDFYSELDSPDVISEIITGLGMVYSNVSADSDQEHAKKLVEKTIESLMKDQITQEDLKDLLGVRITEAILKALENKRKTLFGTAMHSIIESVVLGKDIDLDAPAEAVKHFMDRKTLEKLVYGTANQPGILDTVKKLKEDGSVLVSEFEVGNGKLGGIIDLVAIKKDGTVEVFDFKTKFLRKHKLGKKDFVEEFYTQIKLKSKGGIKADANTIPELHGRTRSLLEKYTQQMSLYKRILMEAGIEVGNIRVIGIPYSIDKETMKINEVKVVVTDPLPYNDELGYFYFSDDIDPRMDAVNRPKELREDPRLKEMEDISKENLKIAFGTMVARLTQAYESFVRGDSSKIRGLLLDQEGRTDEVTEQLNKAKETLDKFDEFRNFLQTQKNFIELIDTSGPIIARVATEFDRLRKTVSTDNESRAQKLDELMKMKDFLIGYQKMFDEILNYFDQNIDPNLGTASEKLIISKIGQMNAVVNNVRNAYVQTITPDIIKTLGDTFTKDLVDNVRREFDEMIASAKARGDNKRVEMLTKMKDELPSDKVIAEFLKGAKGDVGYFFSYMAATISNPDLIVAGVAKRLKAALDRVRLKNKDLRDSLSTELEKRDKVYGRGLDIKQRNESLVYDTLAVDEYTGEEYMVRMIKSEFDEKLYYDYAKLKLALREEQTKENNEEAIKTAKKAIKDFEKKFLMSDYTEEFEKITGTLDVEVTFNGKRQSLKKIVQDIFDDINRVQARYHAEDIAAGSLSEEDLKELQAHWKRYYSLMETLDDNGQPKTGEALRIAQLLNQHQENIKDVYDYVEMTNAFDRAKERVKLTFGEDSLEYQTWLANNTRIQISDEYYARMEEINEEMNSIIPSPEREEVNNLYKELRLLVKPFKDKDGNIQAHLIDAETVSRIKGVEERIAQISDETEKLNKRGLTPEEAQELNEIYYNKNRGLEFDRRRLAELVELGQERLSEIAEGDIERYNELRSELAAMRTMEDTAYYKDELKKRKKQFAESRGISVEQLERSAEYTNEFRETEWFQNNHIYNVRVLFDNESGSNVESYGFRPTYMWRRSMPVEKYIKRIPGRHFYKRVVKDSYVNKNGQTVQLKNTDTRDVKNRRKPKTNEQYRRQYGVDHPYLNKDYVELRDRVNNGRGSIKDKVDYENLIYLQRTMIESQKDIEFNQRLGLAVPFMEKTGLERTVEMKGKNISDAISSAVDGVKRKFQRTETDLDQEGISESKESARMATVDNDQVRFIPVRYRSRGDINNASYDVWGGVLNYVGSINRKMELEKELAFVNGLEEILGDTANQPKSETQNMVFNAIFKKYNIPELERKLNQGTNRRMDVIKSFINSTMYNEEYFSGIEVLGVNTQKAVSTLMGVSSFAILAGAPLNWSVNLISGNVQNIIEAIGGNLIDYDSYLSGKGILYGSGTFNGKYPSAMKDMMADFDKVGNLSFWGQLMEYFDPIQGEFENEFGKKTKFNTVKNIFQLGLFAGKVWGEWEIQMSGFIAFMLNHKVHNGKIYDKDSFITMHMGDISNLTPKEIRDKKLEAINEFSKLKETLLDVFEMKDGKVDVKQQYQDVFSLGSKEFSDIVSKLHSMQKRINGAYAGFDRTYAEKTSIGRMMFFFRKYVIPLGLNRWGEMRVNYEGMQLEQGFYLTFLQTIGKDLVNFRFNVVKNWDNYSDFERRAIKRTLGDVGMILAIFAMYSLLFGFDPDDEDRFKKLKEKGWGQQAMIYMLLKVRSETEQFLPLAGLNEINRIYSNPSLIFNEITRYIDMSGLVLKHAGSAVGAISDDGLYYKSKIDNSGLRDKGDSKLLAKLISSLGYTGRTFNPADAIKSFEYSQRLK